MEQKFNALWMFADGEYVTLRMEVKGYWVTLIKQLFGSNFDFTLTALGVKEEVEKQISATWINVNTKLPNDNEHVLFRTNYENGEMVKLGRFYLKDQFGRPLMFCDGGYFDKAKVTHWLPIPKLD